MKSSLPVSQGRAALRVLWQLSLLSAVGMMLGCRSAERFNLPFDDLDALQSLIDAPGTGGSLAGDGGGAGGQPYGSGGISGSGTGGAIAAGSGGDTAIVDAAADASSDDGAADGGGGSTTPPDAAADLAGTGGAAGAMDTSPELAIDYCQNTRWTAKASASVNNPVAAPKAGIDSDLVTRWGSGRFQDGTDWYQVDFGGPVRLDSITLDNSKSYPSDWPGGYAVHGSSDGTTFGAPFAMGSGADSKTVITFPAQTVRAIKINQTGISRRQFWWQIGEFQIHCSM